MNQYRCDETCNKKDTEQCPIETSTLERQAESVSEVCGLACHSNFQSGRDKVLDELKEFADKISTNNRHLEKKYGNLSQNNWDNVYKRGKGAGVAIFCEQVLKQKIAELRQKAGD
jgi:hypothetical protein